MQIFSLERLGGSSRQTNLTGSISWIHKLILNEVPVYQCIKDILIETKEYPEGHLYPAGTLLIESDETAPNDVIIDNCNGQKINKASYRKLKLPRKLLIYNGLNSIEDFFKPFRELLNVFSVPYEETNDKEIRDGILDDCDLLIVPGGPDAGESYYAGLGNKGIQQVVKFIENGGNYIGSCAGSYFPLTARKESPEQRMWLNIVGATDITGIDYAQRGTGFVRVDLPAANHPALFGIAYGLPTSIDVIYWEGPVFNLCDPNIRVLATFQSLLTSGAEFPKWKPKNQYAADALIYPNPLTRERFEKHLHNMPAAIEALYGKGRLILYSFHPEFGAPTAEKWESSLPLLFIINSIYDLCSEKI